MKNSTLLAIPASLLLGLFLTSCGPSQALLDSRAKVDKLQKDSVMTQNQLNECYAQVTNLKSDKSSLQGDNAMAQYDLKALAAQSNLTIAEQAKRLKSLQDIIQSQKDVMGNLKNSIASALMNFKSDELSVYIKDGNVYVSMEEKLLFKSGSSIVDAKGKEALKALSLVLNSTQNINVVIEGHTDDVPIKTSQFKDNWDLSALRATSIVRILTTDDGFDSNRITASGKGKFHPVKPNDTEIGRAGNRRTEVILSPDMKELYNLFN